MPVDSKIRILSSAEADLALVDALWGGTRSMREAGKVSLPQEKAEEKKDWEIRRDRSTLTNFFRKSVSTMAGRLFEDPVTVKDADAFLPFAENVDLEGRNLHRFGYDLTKGSLRDGLRFIVVDAPLAIDVKTRADEQAAGIRPYWIEVDIRNVRGWKTVDVAGQRVLSQFRMQETVTENTDEFTEKEVQQIRVIEPGRVRLYRKDAKGDWQPHKEIITSIAFVPVVPVYAGRQGFMEFAPPLMDLAWLNVEHWQKSSDQSNILHVARVPILHWAGYKPKHDESGNEAGIVIGPNALATSSDANAKLEYVEHSGAAIGAGRQDLIDIEDRAVAMGAEFAAPNKSGDITATAAVLDESGDVSELSAFAQNVKDSMELAMSYTGVMMGTEFTGSITINTDLGIIETPVNIPELVKIRAMRDISREGMFDILNDEWGTTLDSATEAERVEDEGGMPVDA